MPDSQSLSDRCTCDRSGEDPRCPEHGYEAVIARLTAENAQSRKALALAVRDVTEIRGVPATVDGYLTAASREVPSRCTEESESFGQCTLPAGHEGIHWIGTERAERPAGTVSALALEAANREAARARAEAYDLRAENQRLRKTIEMLDEALIRIVRTSGDAEMVLGIARAARARLPLPFPVFSGATDETLAPEEGNDAV